MSKSSTPTLIVQSVLVFFVLSAILPASSFSSSSASLSSQSRPEPSGEGQARSDTLDASDIDLSYRPEFVWGGPVTAVAADERWVVTAEGPRLKLAPVGLGRAPISTSPLLGARPVSSLAMAGGTVHAAMGRSGIASLTYRDGALALLATHDAQGDVRRLRACAGDHVCALVEASSTEVDQRTTLLLLEPGEGGLSERGRLSIDGALPGPMHALDSLLVWADPRGRVRVVDLADSRAPEVLGEVELEVNDFAAMDEAALFVATDDGIQTLDLRDPRNPSVSSNVFDSFDADRLVRAGQRLVAFAEGYNQPSVRTYDVQNDAEPTLRVLEDKLLSPRLIFEDAAFVSLVGDEASIVSDGERVYLPFQEHGLMTMETGAAPSEVPPTTFFESSASDMVLRGDLLFSTSTRSGLQIWDVADISAPKPLWQEPDATTAWVSVGEGFMLSIVDRVTRLYDIEDPRQPRLITLEKPFSGRLHANGDLLLELRSGSDAGITAYDMSEPSLPAELWTLSLPEIKTTNLPAREGPAGGVEFGFGGGYLWLLQPDRIGVWDMKARDQPPSFVDSLSIDYPILGPLRVGEGVAAFETGKGPRIFFVDPTGTRILEGETTAMRSYDLEFEGRRLVTTGVDGAFVYDLLPPALVVERMYLEPRGRGANVFARQAAVEGERLVLGYGAHDEDAHVFDISKSLHAGLAVRGRTLWQESYDLDLDDAFAYVSHDSGVSAIEDLGDGGGRLRVRSFEPRPHRYDNPEHFPRVLADDGRLYTGGLKIFQVAGDQGASMLADYRVNMPDPRPRAIYKHLPAIARANDLAFVSWYFAVPALEDRPEETVLDIVSEPALLAVDEAHEARLSRIHVGVTTEAMVALDGWLYIGSRGEGLRVVDVRDPELPTLEPHRLDSGTYRALEVIGQHLVALVHDGPVAAAQTSHLEVLSLANPQAPEPIARLDLDLGWPPFSAGQLSTGVVGQRAYAAVAMGDEGVMIIDLYDPGRPLIAGRVQTGWSIDDVELHDDTLSMSAEGGLILRVKLEDLEANERLTKTWLPALWK